MHRLIDKAKSPTPVDEGHHFQWDGVITILLVKEERVLACPVTTAMWLIPRRGAESCVARRGRPPASVPPAALISTAESQRLGDRVSLHPSG